jgi:subtilisin family serine protease
MAQDTDGPPSQGELAAILEAWQVERKAALTTAGPPVRFVASFDGPLPADPVLAEAGTRQLGVPVTASPLFAPDPALDHYRLLRVPGVSRPERADLFEVAAALRDALGASVVEPDLGTDYYLDDTMPADRPGPESIDDLAFWCLAPPGAQPADRDWALAQTAVREAWAAAAAQGKPARGRGIVICQPDTGVVSAHIELPPGIAHDARAANFVEGGAIAEDPLAHGLTPGHGTGTASVVASPPDGAMTGAAPEATLVPIRCVESVALLDQSGVAQAIDHARRVGAHVVTMSLGGVPSLAVHAALRRAVQANIIVVAAAGNCVGEVVWPARYAEAIAIGGINAALKPWRGSSHGPAVAICGPAEFVLRANGRDTAQPPAAVGSSQGTSFATALIAGVAALWLAYHGRDTLIARLPPGRSLQEMFRRLVAASASVPPGHDTEEYGAGIVDARALLERDPATAFAAEAAGASGAEDVLAEVAALVARTFGQSGQEAAVPVLADRQHTAEIACAAFDRARQAASRRAYFESLPPVGLSSPLRRRLGAAAALIS